MAKKVFARVLSNIESLGLLCGHLLESAEEHIAALAAAGLVDPHPDAVAYAKAQKAKVVRLADTGGAQELAAAMTSSPIPDPDLPQDPPHDLSTDQVQTLTTDQAPVLTTDQVQALATDQVAALDAAPLDTLSDNTAQA